MDERVDTLSEMIDAIQKKYRGKEPPRDDKRVIVSKLSAIARTDAAGGQKITRARNALEGLGLRCFNRWTTAHMLVNSDAYVDRLLSEISKSADDKLTRKLLATTKRFPRRRGIEARILGMIKGEQIIFPYQEAECLRAIRYLSTVTQEMQDHAWERLVDVSNERYLRMEAAYLLSRTAMTVERLGSLRERFDSEADLYVQAAIATLLVQRRDDNQHIVRLFVFHPNEKIQNMGRFFRTIKNDFSVAKKALRHALRPQTPWILCDTMPVLHLMAHSASSEIKKLLLDSIRVPRTNHPIGGLRPILKDIFTRTRVSLSGAA